MLLLDRDNLAEYLRSTGRIDGDREVRIELLAGGVSNIVLRVDPDGAGAPPFVIKQARERLRTEAPWFSRLDRIWRETAMMTAVGALLPAGAVPRILFEDRENFVFAMQAVDRWHVVWKQELLAGRIRAEIAVRLGEYLSTIHRETRRDTILAGEFDDREIFVQLRVDPFYRHIARVHADLRPSVERLIDEMWQTRVCLVHADFSPKNVLIVEPPVDDNLRSGRDDLRVILVDFETGHFGDPAFDLGFFLSHLVLKAVRAREERRSGGLEAAQLVALADTFWQSYRSGIASIADDRAFEPAALERRAVSHLAGCALARVDGTSPVDYLPHLPQRELVRQIGRRILLDRTERLADVYAWVTT